MRNFQEKDELRGAGIQTYAFEIRAGHRPTSWTSCVSLPVAISKFLSQTLGGNAGAVASCLFGGSEQFTAPGQIPENSFLPQDRHFCWMQVSQQFAAANDLCETTYR